MPPPLKAWTNRFSELYEKHVKGVPQPPAISPTTAALLSILFTVVYVAPFYLSSATRPSPKLARDAPSSIRARVRAVTLSCIFSTVVAVLVLHRSGNVSVPGILRLFGFYPVSPLDTARTLLLVAVLFAGPLFEHGIVEGGLSRWIRGKDVHQSLSSWIGYRNYVVGPISEELIWRSLIVTLHVLARTPGKQIIFLTPLYFGIAHIHHLYEFRITHPQTPVAQAIARSLFQFAYTSLFGFFATFVLLRTGNVYSAILAHTFCNWMGLPRFYGRVGMEAGVPIGPPSTGEDGGPKPKAQAQRSSSMLTIVYYVVLVAGAFGFYKLLFPLTDSSHALPVVLIEE